MSPNEITSSEEYTCVVSIKVGCPIMTHSYGGMVIDCHPIPYSMVAATLGGGNHPLAYAEESLKDSKFEENGEFCDKIGLNNGVETRNKNKDNKS
ncbi:hypothetical protein CTI12_AA516730 [Artemisia annua]|uniref:Uncharacterized protein n=1 Tax=Artemisia annua TaxID=35608 RepID=A0A2U1L943_ARTAN|nr:hypothetical protein CTI12_AA516730 [Artemisia annua]